MAYRLKTPDGLPEGLPTIEAALVFNTSDTTAEREQNDLGDPLESIWGRCVLPYCGVKRYQRHVFRPVVGSSDARRREWLDRVDDSVGRMFAASEVQSPMSAQRDGAGLGLVP